MLHKGYIFYVINESNMIFVHVRSLILKLFIKKAICQLVGQFAIIINIAVY